jgi:hypothetical protein
MSPRFAATLPALLALLLPLLGGCQNDCQKLCKEIADYWADCGLDYGDEELADCRKQFKGNNELPGEDEVTYLDRYEGACRTLLSREENEDGDRMIALRARFSCEDMELGPGGAFGTNGQ